MPVTTHLESCVKLKGKDAERRSMSFNYTYCSKGGIFLTNIDPSNFEVESGRAKPLTAWERESNELKEYFSKFTLKQWQQEILDLVKERCPPDSRTVHWYWEGEGNAGKTWFGKYLYNMLPGTMYVAGKAHDVFNMITNYKEELDVVPRLIILDQPRSIDAKYISMSTIEKLKDGFLMAGKYKGGIHQFFPPHVLVLANVPPSQEQRARLSSDRWHVVEIPTDGPAWTNGGGGEGIAVMAPQEDDPICMGCNYCKSLCECKEVIEISD